MAYCPSGQFMQWGLFAAFIWGHHAMLPPRTMAPLTQTAFLRTLSQRRLRSIIHSDTDYNFKFCRWKTICMKYPSIRHPKKLQYYHNHCKKKNLPLLCAKLAATQSENISKHVRARVLYKAILYPKGHFPVASCLCFNSK